jgi:hypothetical protein
VATKKENAPSADTISIRLMFRIKISALCATSVCSSV